ncbi:MAG: hypothetical protein ACRD21_02495, partial [Vicinamibacteria bacterium]
MKKMFEKLPPREKTWKPIASSTGGETRSTDQDTLTRRKTMENHRFARIVPILLLTFIPIASPAISQEKRVEINPFFGYSFS